MSDGTIVTKGGDISGAVRVSVIPAEGVPLPRHDFIGLRFKRRFLKQFKRLPVSRPPDRSAIALEIDEKRGFTEEERRVRQEKRKKFWQKKGFVTEAKADLKPSNAAHCIETATGRFWVVCLNGAVLGTPKDYDLRL